MPCSCAPGLGGFLPVAAAQECRGDAPVAPTSGKGQAVTVAAVVRAQTAVRPTPRPSASDSGWFNMAEYPRSSTKWVTDTRPRLSYPAR